MPHSERVRAGSFIALALLAVTMALPTGHAFAADTLTYRNERFGTEVTFPAHAFDTLAEAPADSDGQRFLGPDGAELLVYASTGSSLGEEAQQTRDGLSPITLDRVENSWFAISGIDGAGAVFYRRTEIGPDGALHSAILRYPTDAKPRLDPLVGDIVNSLRVR